ncbi:MAG: phage integrase N-terminal SAM-like domain-containing protein [Thermodesulfobacteriota bacterium]
MYISPELWHRINLYKAKGGKKGRKRNVSRINTFLKFCRTERQKKTPYEIGKRDIHEFFEQKNLSPRTAQDYYYAIKILWQQLLGRPSDPPRPR